MLYRTRYHQMAIPLPTPFRCKDWFPRSTHFCQYSANQDCRISSLFTVKTALTPTRLYRPYDTLPRDGVPCFLSLRSALAATSIAGKKRLYLHRQRYTIELQKDTRHKPAALVYTVLGLKRKKNTTSLRWKTEHAAPPSHGMDQDFSARTGG